MEWSSRDYRSLTIAEHPAVEPVTVAEAKDHLRIDGAQDDAMLGHYITAARAFIEKRLHRSLIDTRWVIRRDTFPDYAQELVRPPFSPTAERQAVVVTYIKDDDAGTLATMEEGNHYVVDRHTTPPLVSPGGDELWPPVAAVENAVSITWWSGYGATGADVPAPLRQAVMMLSGAWFLHREAVSTEGPTPIPYGVEAILDMYKWGGEGYG